MPHTNDLHQEICERAAEVAELLDEFDDARAVAGRGTHRDPETVLRELRTEAVGLLAAAKEARDEIERAERGLG